MRVGFAGTPAFAATRARRARSPPGITMPLVLTQPDRPTGRGLQLAASRGQTPCRRTGVRRSCSRGRLKDAASRAALLAIPVDVLVVAAYGLILPARGPRMAAPRLPQHPRFAAAALARRGADRARRRGWRRDDRHHDHADGRGARHRRGDRGARARHRRARDGRDAARSARGPGRGDDRRRAGHPGVDRTPREPAATRVRRHLCRQARSARMPGSTGTQTAGRDRSQDPRDSPSPGAAATWQADAFKLWLAEVPGAGGYADASAGPGTAAARARHDRRGRRGRDRRRLRTPVLAASCASSRSSPQAAGACRRRHSRRTPHRAGPRFGTVSA